MTAKSKKPAPAPAARFVRAAGASISDADAAVIGEELLKIAEANRVGDVRSLDKYLVLAAVEDDPNHPLRRFYEWDVEKAARRHWLARTDALIRSVRIVSLNVRKHEKPSPLFLYVPVGDKDRLSRRIADGARRRSRVLIDDVLKNDPDFGSALTAQIRSIRHTVDRFSHLVRQRRSPKTYVELARSLSQALEDFEASSQSDAAE